MRMKPKNLFLTAIACGLQTITTAQTNENLIYKSNAYRIFTNRVEQADFKAIVLSPTEMTSNYRSPDAHKFSPIVRFKFSINSRDNEMLSGMDHFVNLQPVNGIVDKHIIKFGTQYIDTANIPVKQLPTDTKWTVKLDLRDVQKAFKEKGFYTLFNGNKIYQADFKGVYIAGGTEPLSWDFENLHNAPSYELTDNDRDGIFEVTLVMNPHKEEASTATWKLSSDISAFPGFHSEQALSEALYNLSLEEMLKDIRPDGAYMAGEKWEGVWTRDISYAIHLTLAAIQPEVAKKSLMYKVKNKRIIQDTGSGGSWPVSTDRTVWAIAAWDIYKVTGDNEWLKQSFEIIRNTWTDDIKTAYNAETGLYYGESSFLDWREQTYPKWMEPIDIYKSQNLGTNAIHYEVANILAQMAGVLGKPSNEFLQVAANVKAGMDKWLWLPDKGYYGQYSYGGNYQITSPRSEALGEALTVLFGIAGPQRQKSIVSSTPVTAFGIPCIFPQIQQIQPYHNDAVWPFVQAYWALASAKTANEEAVLQSIAAIYRQAALFLTNKENFVASTGDYKGTAINSNRQLWSVAANLALVYRLFFGMDFQPEGLYFHPFIPETFKGEKELSSFRYRDAILDIKISGSGNHLQSFKIDGKTVAKTFIPANLKGKHTIVMVLDGKSLAKQPINMQNVDYSLPTPVYNVIADKLHFPTTDVIQKYIVYRNGRKFIETSGNQVSLPVDDYYAEYMVTAVDKSGYETFSPKPLKRISDKNEWLFEAEQFADVSSLAYKGFSGSGFVELTIDKNTSFPITLKVESEGDYLISFRYSNGSGPVNTDNKCAIRTLFCNGAAIGAIVMPQHGKDEWSNWGESNALRVHLPAGSQHLSLDLVLPQNQNMNGEVNSVMLDAILLTKSQ